MLAVALILSVLIGYLLGSVNSSIIIGKLLHGKDVRELGSGNAGATNTLRTLGRKAAILVLIGDILKGLMACLAGQLLGEFLGGGGVEGAITGKCLAGLAAVLGHNWPLYFGFRGGKGVLTSAAVLFYLAPMPALGCLLVFVAALAIWKTVSLGSMLAAVVFPILSLLLQEPVQILLVGSTMALLILVRHHGNIRRLLAGTEPRITDKKDKTASPA